MLHRFHRSRSRICHTPALTAGTMRCPRRTAQATPPAALSATAMCATRKPLTARCGAPVSALQRTLSYAPRQCDEHPLKPSSAPPAHHDVDHPATLQAPAGTTTATHAGSTPTGTPCDSCPGRATAQRSSRCSTPRPPPRRQPPQSSPPHLRPPPGRQPWGRPRPAPSPRHHSAQRSRQLIRSTPLRSAPWRRAQGG